jgi:hypothetical protein
VLAAQGQGERLARPARARDRLRRESGRTGLSQRLFDLPERPGAQMLERGAVRDADAPLVADVDSRRNAVDDGLQLRRASETSSCTSTSSPDFLLYRRSVRYRSTSPATSAAKLPRGVSREVGSRNFANGTPRSSSKP